MWKNDRSLVRKESKIISVRVNHGKTIELSVYFDNRHSSWISLRHSLSVAKTKGGAFVFGDQDNKNPVLSRPCARSSVARRFRRTTRDGIARPVRACAVSIIIRSVLLTATIKGCVRRRRLGP